MKIAITANDGKVFIGDDYYKLEKELNAHEANIKLKQQEELEKKQKIEAERKKAEEAEVIFLKNINDDFNKLAASIKEYEKTTGRKVVYAFDGMSGNGRLTTTRHSIDFAWDYPLQRIVEGLLGLK